MCKKKLKFDLLRRLIMMILNGLMLDLSLVIIFLHNGFYWLGEYSKPNIFFYW